MTLAEHIRAQRRAVADAETELDQAADDMARAILGRLQHVRGYTLQALKRALQNVDGRNGQWKR